MKNNRNATNIIIVLDALKSSFIENINSRISFHIRRERKMEKLTGEIIPPFSFEPDEAFLTGHYPEETNSGTHFCYAPRTSPFYGMQRFFKVVDRMPYTIQVALRRWLRWYVKHRIEAGRLRRDVHTARIPFRFLRYFDIVGKYSPLDEGFSQFPTIFDLLKRSGKKATYLGAPISSPRSKDVLSRLRETPLSGTDLLFLFVGDLDEIGHRYGPASKEYYEGIQDMGDFIEEVITLVRRQARLSSILIFGDHGMVEVNKIVDLQTLLQSLPVIPTKDYVYFLDSTMARFWFFNKCARQIVTEAMQEIKDGRFITNEDRIKYRIRYRDNRFGELIWWADGRTLILPNFWQGNKWVKGMHGYRHEVRENHAGFLLLDPHLKETKIFENPIEMVDIFATIVDMLGLDMPEGAHGRSLYT